MRKVFFTLGIIAAVVAAGAMLGWLAGRGPGTQNPPDASTVVHTTGEQHPAPPIVTTHGGVKPRTGTNASPENSALVSETGNTGTETNWEDKLETILNSETDDTNKVNQLFVMFPHVPVDGQTELAQHPSNLVEDEHYAQLGQLLKDGHLPE